MTHAKQCKHMLMVAFDFYSIFFPILWKSMVTVNYLVTSTLQNSSTSIFWVNYAFKAHLNIADLKNLFVLCDHPATTQFCCQTFILTQWNWERWIKRCEEWQACFPQGCGAKIFPTWSCTGGQPEEWLKRSFISGCWERYYNFSARPCGVWSTANPLLSVTEEMHCKEQVMHARSRYLNWSYTGMQLDR